MVTLYIINSLVKKFRYVGITNNLNKRIIQHNNGNNKSTRLYRPFELIYTENLINYKEARKRERFFKSGIGRKFIDQITIA